MNPQIEQYRTPSGFTDFPFTFVFDATGIADTNPNLPNQIKALQGDADFILRSVIGLDTVVDTPANSGKVMLYNGSGSEMFSRPIIAPANLAVLPEKRYAYNEQIKFDLANTLRAFTACGGTPIYTSYIGFRGVKRFVGSHGYSSNRSPYVFRELPQVYSFNLTLTTARYTTPGSTNVNPALRFFQSMDQYDFELLRILVSQPGSVGGLTTNDFAMTLYDANEHALSDLPQPVLWMSSAKPTRTTMPRYQPVVPVPPLVYPAGGSIRFDITSLLCNTSLPQSYNIAFHGVWRIPCVNPRT